MKIQDSQKIKQYAASLGLTECGIAPAILEGTIGKAPICPLAAGQGADRFDAEAQLPGCQSIIVVLFPYFVPDDGPSNLSLYCRPADYHLVVRDYLQRLIDFLAQAVPGSQHKAIVDTSPLSDRWLAYKAGLGFFGDNGCFINDACGSYCFIGSILTTIPMAFDTPLAKECIHCGQCHRACPGQCFESGSYDYIYCKSYLTQKKGTLTVPEIDVLKKTGLIFGCDECQRCCPHNRSLAATPIAEFHRDRLTMLRQSDIEGLTNREFKQQYGAYAFSWRGKKLLLRNMEYITGSIPAHPSSKD